MTDFFAGVYGARFPDVIINGGGNPLPGMGGLPAPLHDTPDAKINYNSSLLGDLEPYAYGEPGYLSSQSSYLNIPHRIQKLVPTLWIPETDGTGSFRLCHPIDDGDIAFTMRLDRNSEVCTGLRSKSILRSGLGTAIDPMINLCTLNYILAGMQICTQLDATRPAWDRLFNYLDKERFRGYVPGGGAAHQYNFEDIKCLTRHLCRPFGVAHGSEKQGGQHEGGYSPVTWPVNFVISLVLDGKDANVVNIWHRHDVEAGNDLVLRLKLVPLPPGNKYTLNHYSKALMEKTFSTNLLDQIAENGLGAPHRFTHIWQLVPDVFSLDLEEPLNNAHMHPNFIPVRPRFVWQQEGYWHIARAQIHCKKYGTEEYYYNDLANNLRTGHMDLTFQPTFLAVPFRDPNAAGGPAVHARQNGGNQRNVFNFVGIGKEASDGGGKRTWNHALRLERGFDALPSPVSQRSLSYDSLRPSLGSDAGSNKRVRFVTMVEYPEDYMDRHQPVSAEPPRAVAAPGFSFEEDIGIMEDAGPLLAPSRSVAEPFASGVSESTAVDADARPQFSVPKPGLKNTKRTAQRGKGVIGAVLGIDGSVTHEPSRML
jgi:hypothetical protein